MYSESNNDGSYNVSEDDNISDNISDNNSDNNSEASEYLSDNELNPEDINEVNHSNKTSQEQSTPIIDNKLLLGTDDKHNITLNSDEEMDDNMEEIPDITGDTNLNTIILESHPEINSVNDTELKLLTKIKYTKDGTINDPLHKTTPILSKYEKTKIIGQRAKQIQEGAKPFIQHHNIIDSYLIACMELEANKIPFIIKRPLPNNTFEYWKITDLLNLY